MGTQLVARKQIGTWACPILRVRAGTTFASYTALLYK